MAANDPILAAEVWKRYQRDQPKPGHEFNAWAHTFSEESGIPAGTIRFVVSRGSAAMLNAMSERLQTTAQQVADMMGADLVAALDVLRDAMTASNKKLVKDSKSRPVLIDPEGSHTAENFMYTETPDWQTRLSAVRSLIEIHGARAPQQYEIEQKTITLDLTREAALAELERLADALPKLQAALNASPRRPARALGPGTTPPGPTRPC